MNYISLFVTIARNIIVFGLTAFPFLIDTKKKRERVKVKAKICKNMNQNGDRQSMK